MTSSRRWQRVGGTLAGGLVGLGLGLAAPAARDWLTSRRSAVTPEAANLLEYQRFQESIATHFRQPRAAWAPGAEEDFRGDLGLAATESGGELLKLDCRSITCYAEIRWPTRDVAVAGADRVVRQQFRRNCFQKIILPPPASKSPGTAQMMVDCGKPV